jgi:hypothetical protein
MFNAEARWSLRVDSKEGFERTAGRTADPSTALRSSRDDRDESSDRQDVFGAYPRVIRDQTGLTL